MKTYLSVPFSEKEEAKSLGAKWDPEKKQWYAPYGEENLVSRWSKITMMGENREFGGNLFFVDLIPSSCWFKNVRSSIYPGLG